MLSKITTDLIAPCGMNCGVCKAFLREKNSCSGCCKTKQSKFKSINRCQLRLCTKRTGDYCFNCTEFPCDRLKHLDKRYRTKYMMSEIDNLKYIQENGIEKFVEKENKRWVSGKGVFCVHDKKYYPLGKLGI